MWGIMLQKMSDALAILATDQNVDVIKRPSTQGAIWELLSYPYKVDAPRNYGESTNYFDEMIAASLWITRGKSHKNQQQYFPVPRCVGPLEDVNVPKCDPDATTLPELINKSALGKYADSQTRRGEAALLRNFDRRRTSRLRGYLRINHKIRAA